MDNADTLNITQIQIEAAKLAGQYFFWRLVLDGGKTVDQYDPITGAAQQFPNWVTWVDKSPLDPFAGNPAFRGIKAAYWIPVYAGNDGAFATELGDAHSIIIFRKNYIRDTGGTYHVYCMGRRWEEDTPKEHIFHICPPARYLKADGTVAVFSGGVSLVKEALGQNDFDRFLTNNR